MDWKSKEWTALSFPSLHFPSLLASTYGKTVRRQLQYMTSACLATLHHATPRIAMSRISADGGFERRNDYGNVYLRGSDGPQWGVAGRGVAGQGGPTGGAQINTFETGRTPYACMHQMHTMLAVWVATSHVTLN